MREVVQAVDLVLAVVDLPEERPSLLRENAGCGLDLAFTQKDGDLFCRFGRASRIGQVFSQHRGLV